MEKEFVPYDSALRLKELGFNDQCFAYWFSPNDTFLSADLVYNIAGGKNNKDNGCFAPLWQQAFEWLCKEVEFNDLSLSLDYNSDGWWLCIHEEETNDILEILTNEEALGKLIEIIENENRT